MKAIFEEGVRPTLSELRLFLKAIEEIVIPAAVNPVDAGASQFTWEEQVKVIGGALRKRIEEKLGDRVKPSNGGVSVRPTIHRMMF